VVAVGNEPEAERPVEARISRVDLVSGREMGKGVVEEGVVFGKGQCLDVGEGLDERLSEAGQ
jgi:hypothetical protein